MKSQTAPANSAADDDDDEINPSHQKPWSPLKFSDLDEWETLWQQALAGEQSAYDRLKTLEAQSPGRARASAPATLLAPGGVAGIRSNSRSPAIGWPAGCKPAALTGPLAGASIDVRVVKIIQPRPKPSGVPICSILEPRLARSLIFSTGGFSHSASLATSNKSRRSWNHNTIGFQPAPRRSGHNCYWQASISLPGLAMRNRRRKRIRFGKNSTTCPISICNSRGLSTERNICDRLPRAGVCLGGRAVCFENYSPSFAIPRSIHLKISRHAPWRFCIS